MSFKALFYPVICLFLAIILENSALGKPIPEKMAVRAIIGEAENQGPFGMEMVACAIRNRGTLHGVYGLHSARVVMGKYSSEIALAAHKAWRESENPEACTPIHGASNWENVGAFGVPWWAVGMKRVFVYRDHVFLK